jgi:diguanylate cyclase (GGDEF)-like protein/PAS domain S-box-containing protein
MARNLPVLPTQWPVHPRKLGWFGTSSLALGGSNQSIFILSALFIGQGDVLGQGSMSIALLILGVLLALLAVPGWIELLLMYPNRVGGISATCAEAFRPYNPILANLAGVCYWWGWVPTSGLCALLAATALKEWFMPQLLVFPAAVGLVVILTLINLAGVQWAARLAMPIASLAAFLAFLSGLIPVFAGTVDWHEAFHLELATPFPGWFGQMTSLMSGLFLIGFVAPAFETAACHVGEMKQPEKNLPLTMYVSAGMAALFFIVLPVIWHGALGAMPLGQDLSEGLGPTFAPLFGNAAKSVALWFIILNLLLCSLQPLAGAPRTLSQIADDGLLPKVFSLRSSKTDVPWFSTIFTSTMAIFFLYLGDPLWLIAATNFTYVFGGLFLPSVAVWLLRRNAPDAPRLYRAPKGAVRLGIFAAGAWVATVIFGFQQFGLNTIIVGLIFATSGAVFYVIRKITDYHEAGLPIKWNNLHLKLAGPMLLVLFFSGVGFYIAIDELNASASILRTVLQDLFVVITILTVAVGLILPGKLSHAVEALSNQARQLAYGAMADFSKAMQALGRGDLESAKTQVDIKFLEVNSTDEIGEMAKSFNLLQTEISSAVNGLEGARNGLSTTRNELVLALEQTNQSLASLKESERRFKLMANSAPVLIWLSNKDGKTEWVNQYWTDFTGCGTEQEKLLSCVSHAHPDDHIANKRFYQKFAALQPFTLEYRLRRHDGQYRWVIENGVPLFDEQNNFTGFISTIIDIHDKKLADEMLIAQANYDELTGKPNRRLFLDRLNQETKKALRNKTQVALLLIDLDHFKYVNDTLGHDQGDFLLIEVANRIASCIRESDTLSRIGGDEFTIILSDIMQLSDIDKVTKNILSKLSLPFQLGLEKCFISASIGVAVYPDDGVVIDELFKNADLAMYQAKAEGRNRSNYFTSALERKNNGRIRLIGDLHSALKNNELYLMYQPIIELSTGRLKKAEALIRWQHPTQGLITPDVFIPIAEDSGLIIEIGNWIFKQVALKTKQLRDNGYSNFQMSFNKSPVQFRDSESDVIGSWLQILKELNLPPNSVSVEITESLMLEATSSVYNKLDQLKQSGIEIAIDDFGTGYSSLSYLKKLEVDYLKIDKSFVDDLTEESNDKVLCEAMIVMAHKLGLKVIAEGIETEMQLNLLQLAGCDYGQGYLFSRPLKQEAFDDYLKNTQSALMPAQI